MPVLSDVEEPAPNDAGRLTRNTHPNNQRQSGPNQRQSAATKSRRGGKRPGAGAPNAAERHGRRQTDADQLAWDLLQNTLARAVRVNRRRAANDGLSIVPRALNHHTNKGEDPRPPIFQHENAPETPNHLCHNRTLGTNPPEQSPARYETTHD